jgi:hypothetical protein
MHHETSKLEFQSVIRYSHIHFSPSLCKARKMESPVAFPELASHHHHVQCIMGGGGYANTSISVQSPHSGKERGSKSTKGCVHVCQHGRHRATAIRVAGRLFPLTVSGDRT